ncbi:hypothetical protein TREES_T100008307 [Tupaia chinensis]|uniref:Uncharacterized protein n=1 Tax=Tupaia chinensis TaxID=246437 RepID=L9LAY4_TUPCH|nr:hypothetical protein TREES_T100008307 [Tupaia chinensis]
MPAVPRAEEGNWGQGSMAGEKPVDVESQSFPDGVYAATEKHDRELGAIAWCHEGTWRALQPLCLSSLWILRMERGRLSQLQCSAPPLVASRTMAEVRNQVTITHSPRRAASAADTVRLARARSYEADAEALEQPQGACLFPCLSQGLAYSTSDQDELCGGLRPYADQPSLTVRLTAALELVYMAQRVWAGRLTSLPHPVLDFGQYIPPGVTS